MPKKVLIAIPPAMLEEVDFIARCEHRTRSDLIREALRRYIENFRRQEVPRRVIEFKQPETLSSKESLLGPLDTNQRRDLFRR